MFKLCVHAGPFGVQAFLQTLCSTRGASPWSAALVGKALVAISFSTKSPDLLSSVIRVISHASRHHSSVQAGSVRLCWPDTPGAPTRLSRDSHRSRAGPSQPARRVISAITSFGPRLSWGLLETGQEGGLLPLRAPAPGGDRRAMLLR